MTEPDPAQALKAELLRNYVIEEGCNFSQHLANTFLSEAEFYLKTIEEFIATKRAAEIAVLQTEAGLLSPARRPDYWAWHYPVHWEDVFEAQLRSAFVVTLASFVEDYLSPFSAP